MRKFSLLICAASIGFGAIAQTTIPKLSPHTKAYLIDAAKLNAQKVLPEGYVYKKRNDGTLCVS
ncbi:MAG: hypothetical protein IT256_06535, partial [Chitinophagaceae bacterium]|nr:hypothetical protein [Chitinophagaceae bacterium]